jgi:phasin family protein
MTTKNEFGEIQRKNMEAAMRLAQLSIENSQKIMALQSQLARDLLTDSLSQAKDHADKTDPLDVISLRARYTQESMQKMLAAAKEIAEIGNSARSEFSRLLTEQLAAGSQEMVDAFQSFFKALPGQNTNVLDTMQQAMANANAAFEQMSKASANAFGTMNSAGTTRKK